MADSRPGILHGNSRLADLPDNRERVFLEIYSFTLEHDLSF
jgi:hypothetical protein